MAEHQHRTISLGKDLDKRMKRLKNPPNWSRVAQQAFEKVLAEEPTKKRGRLSDLVAKVFFHQNEALRLLRLLRS